MDAPCLIRGIFRIPLLWSNVTSYLLSCCLEHDCVELFIKRKIICRPSTARLCCLENLLATGWAC